MMAITPDTVFFKRAINFRYRLTIDAIPSVPHNKIFDNGILFPSKYSLTFCIEDRGQIPNKQHFFH